ncbi:MAG: hypothetical protein ACO1Q7_11130 [Gemmatimonas sp.]
MSLRVVMLLGVAWAFAACDRRTPDTPAESGTVVFHANPSDSLRPVAGTGWDAAAGLVLVLPAVDGTVDAGTIIRPEATELTVGDTAGLTAAGTQLELFSRGALYGEASYAAERVGGLDSGCTAWPIARLAGLPKSGLAPGAGVVTPGAPVAPRAWTAAFQKGKVTLVPMDSIEGLASRDSANLAANLARLASALKDDTAATFRGLPFVVLRAFRAKAAGQSFVVATLVRRLNQEDNPLEERLLMIVDGDTATPGTWNVGWHERASGKEEELVVSEPLLAFTPASNAKVHVVFGRDDGYALSATMLSREGTGPNSGWKVLWESALAGCVR